MICTAEIFIGVIKLGNKWEEFVARGRYVKVNLLLSRF